MSELTLSIAARYIYATEAPPRRGAKTPSEFQKTTTTHQAFPPFLVLLTATPTTASFFPPFSASAGIEFWRKAMKGLGTK